MTHLVKPGIARETTGRIECLGRGPGAKWRKRVIPFNCVINQVTRCLMKETLKKSLPHQAFTGEL